MDAPLQDLTFRTASLDDAATIAALVNACYRGDVSRRGWTSEADLLDGSRTDADEIRTLLERSDSMLLVCARHDRIVGSVHLALEDRACYVGMLVVAPELQRGGVGARILQAAEDTARRRWAVERMTMTVISARSELIAYYERRGYRRTGEVTPFEEDSRHGVPRMKGLMFARLEKPLAPGAGPTARSRGPANGR